MIYYHVDFSIVKASRYDSINYLSRAPVLFERLRFGHFKLYGRSEKLGRLLVVGHFASWHPKKTIISVQS
jgi:hypothetical protein